MLVIFNEHFLKGVMANLASKKICVSFPSAFKLLGRRSMRSTKRPEVIIVASLEGKQEYPGPTTNEEGNKEALESHVQCVIGELR